MTQINIVIGTVIASLQDGAVSHLYYADRVYELPLAIVGIAIGVVLLPDVSRHLRAGNHAAVMDSQNRSFEFAMLLTVPAAVALAVVPTAIVQGLFQRGAFTAPTRRPPPTRWPSSPSACPSFVLIKVFSPAYFAREDTRTPMRYAVISLTANTLGSIALFFLFRAARPDAAPGHRRGDHARRLAQRRPPLCDAGQARRFVADARLKRALPLHRAGQPASWALRVLGRGHCAAATGSPPPGVLVRAGRALPCWSARACSSTPSPCLALGAVELRQLRGLLRRSRRSPGADVRPPAARLALRRRVAP